MSVHSNMKFTSLYDELFFESLRIRMVEERIIELYPTDKIQSPVHLSIGQEAVAVGACRSMNNKDLLFYGYRSHAFYLAKGGNILQMFAELYGKGTGCGEGKAGSMHLLAPEVGLMVASAVVASTLPHAVGAALATSRLGRNQVIVAAFGDGATEEGVYHESLNFAALHGLPVIFLCENNGLAVHSQLASREAYDIVKHVESYGIPVSSCLEGWDPLKVYGVFSQVVDKVRSDGGPQFVQVHTYRYKEHVGPGEDFQSGYRSREELESWQSKDPLLLDQTLVEKFRPLIRREIDEAVEFAEKSPWPSKEQLLADVI